MILNNYIKLKVRTTLYQLDIIKYIKIHGDDEHKIYNSISLKVEINDKYYYVGNFS